MVSSKTKTKPSINFISLSQPKLQIINTFFQQWTENYSGLSDNSDKILILAVKPFFLLLKDH